MSVANSLSGRCHTFDTKADGYCKAEAINCVYLKRLNDAMAIPSARSSEGAQPTVTVIRPALPVPTQRLKLPLFALPTLTRASSI
jgi:hypothetical protein